MRLACYFLLFPLLSSAQQPGTAFNQTPPLSLTLSSTSIAPLSIGDAVPDISLPHIINYGSPSARLSDFKGKLLILDFFSTWCGACIRELPKLDSLQKKWKDRVQILLVANQPAEEIQALRKRNKTFAANSFPTVTSDTALHRLFPHRLLPHTVWIEPGGKVAAITEPHYLTEENIRALLETGTIQLPVKQDVLDFDRTQPLLQEGNGGTEEALRCRSLITAYLPGVASTNNRNLSKDSTQVRLSFINQSLLSLYEAATGHRFSNRWVLPQKDSSRWSNPGLPLDVWAAANLYSYELTLPASYTAARAKEWMRQDLDRFFNISSSWQKQKVSCWALVRTDKNDARLRTKGGKPLSTLLVKDSRDKLLINHPLSRLTAALNFQAPGGPARPIVIDETGYTGKVDLHLQLEDLYDLPALRKALAPYGLVLVPVERELELLVLSDNPVKQ